MVFSGIEPFGEFAAYHRAGIIAAATTNPHIGKGKPAVKPSDFMPQYEGAKPNKPADLTTQARNTMLAVFGGKPPQSQKAKPGSKPK